MMAFNDNQAFPRERRVSKVSGLFIGRYGVPTGLSYIEALIEDVDVWRFYVAAHSQKVTKLFAERLAQFYSLAVLGASFTATRLENQSPIVRKLPTC
jgi:hypothetical protein